MHLYSAGSSRQLLFRQQFKRLVIAMARASTTADVFNAIAEPRRRQMISLLRDGEEWTVGEIAVRMRIAQPVASKHLQVLRKVGIVNVVKRGRFRCYRLRALSLQPIAEWAGMCNLKI